MAKNRGTKRQAMIYTTQKLRSSVKIQLKTLTDVTSPNSHATLLKHGYLFVNFLVMKTKKQWPKEKWQKTVISTTQKTKDRAT